MKIDERKKIKADAKAKVAEVLAQEDQPKMQAKLEELFNDILTELAAATVDKEKSIDDNTRLSDDLEALKTEKEGLATLKADFEQKALELQKKLEEADLKIKELEGSIVTMKQEAALQARIADLEEAGLLTEGKAAEKQKARIKAMDDEEFAEHKAYLAELRESLAKTLGTNTPVEKSAKTREDCKDKCKGSKDPECMKDCLDDIKEDDTDEEDGGADKRNKAALAALAKLAELDLDESTITTTQLLKIKKAAAALNVASLGISTTEEGADLLGVDDATLKEYAGLWDAEGE